MVDVITSRSNPLVKFAASLKDKKGREKERAFIAEGEKLTIEALCEGLPVSYVFISEGKYERVKDKILPHIQKSGDKNVKAVVLSDSAFEKISTEISPQGVISVIKYLDFFSIIDIIYKKEYFLREHERAIILSSVRDPGNLGSVIRSCVAFGVERIILTGDCADVYNPKVVRSAMGSLFRVNISIVNDSVELVRSLKEAGRRVFAAELRDGAIPISEACLTSEDVIMIGNEGHGIDPDVSAECTKSVYLPISKNTESLNASVAAAIFMWEQNK